MTIAIYLESYISGGMDTVIVNKIKNWPTKAGFIIFYNRDYEEVQFILKKELKKFKVKFISINIFSMEKIYKSLDSKWLVFFTRITSVVLRYLFFILNLFKIIIILKKYNINHIFIHNGGYPGALSTVPCAVGFYMLTKKKPNYVIHSLPYKISYVNFIYEYLSDRLVSYFCKIIFVSKFSCKLMNLRRYTNFQSKIILNGVGIKNFKIKRKNFSTTKFFFSGRICEEKGILFILKNFENLYLNKKLKFKLFICGKISKNIFKQFKFYINASPIKDRIIYLGFVNNERVQYQLSKVDYLILPSLNIENLSMSAIEAFSVGTPIIASNLESIKELVGSNKCNLLFKSGSDLDFKKKIIKISNESSKLRLNKRKKVKDFFLTKFSAKNMSKEYFKLTC